MYVQSDRWAIVCSTCFQHTGGRESEEGVDAGDYTTPVVSVVFQKLHVVDLQQFSSPTQCCFLLNNKVGDQASAALDCAIVAALALSERHVVDVALHFRSTSVHPRPWPRDDRDCLLCAFKTSGVM